MTNDGGVPGDGFVSVKTDQGVALLPFSEGDTVHVVLFPVGNVVERVPLVELLFNWRLTGWRGFKKP